MVADMDLKGIHGRLLGRYAFCFVTKCKILLISSYILYKLTYK